jgi:hypothetical protein
LILYLHHVSLYGVLWLKVPHFHQFVWWPENNFYFVL